MECRVWVSRSFGMESAQLSSIFLGGYYGTHYRVRLYPPLGV